MWTEMLWNESCLIFLPKDLEEVGDLQARMLKGPGKNIFIVGLSFSAGIRDKLYTQSEVPTIALEASAEMSCT